MKSLVTVLLFGISTAFSFGTTYYTLSAGSWSDVGIWSTDGITPCACSPSSQLTGDTVYINHSVVLAAALDVEDLSLVHVGASGKLDGSGYTLTITDATIVANGNMSARKLMVMDGGTVTIQLAELHVITRIEVYGTFNIFTANLDVDMGNIIIHPSGSFNLTGGAKLYFATGNFQNSGITNVGPGSCIQLIAGNIMNETGGVIAGSGSMISEAGNIHNDASWDSAILWCSAGSDFGMPSPENCTQAHANCLGVPLPVELIVFEGTAKPGCNSVVWVTASEYNCDYFVLERSDEGEVWTERAVVNGAGTTSLESYYAVCDPVSESKMYYYRLLQYDYNRDHSISNVIAIHSIGTKATEMYPNPSQGEFFLILDGHEPGMEVIIYDLNGTPVYEKSDIHEEKVAFQVNLPSGLYLVHINRKGNVETLKLVIR